MLLGVNWDLWGSLGVYRSLVGRWVLLLTSNGHVHGAYRRALVSGISTIITIQSTEYAAVCAQKDPNSHQYVGVSDHNRSDHISLVFDRLTANNGHIRQIIQ